MTRAAFILYGQRDRQKAMQTIMLAPAGSRVEVKAPSRTLDQNALMWSLLTAIAGQLTWHGQKYPADDWKDFLMHQLRAGRWMPSEEGGMVPIGKRTSDLSKEEMSDLIEVIHAFGARQGVVFTDFEAARDGGVPNTAPPKAA